MCDGGNTCDTSKVDWRWWRTRLWNKVCWRFHGHIAFRMQELTGFNAWRGSLGPVSEPDWRRPRGVWFWTKQRLRNVFGAFKYRLQASTGFYEHLAKDLWHKST